MRQNRVPTGVPTGGQFTTTVHPETPTALDDSRETITVLDAGGHPVELVPGVIDDEADWAYMNGQCLALAVAISRRTGWPVVTTTYEETEPDVDEPDGYFRHWLLRHAAVRTPEGDLLDIRGPGDPDAIEMYGEERQDTWHPEQLDDLLAESDGYLVHQNLEAAETFVDPVLKLRADDLSRQSPVDGPASTADRVVNPYLDDVGGVLRGPDAMSLRWPAVERYSFTVPDAGGLELVAAHSRAGLLDPLAGNGYWGSLLRKMGVRVTLSDRAPVGTEDAWHKWSHADVEQLDAIESVRRYGADHGAMLLSWVPMEDPIGERLLSEFPGDTVIVMGDRDDNICGTDGMYEALERDWELVDTHTPPQWLSINDTIDVYRRRGPL